MTTPANKKRVAILGSTGSIGTQTLDVIRRHSDKFEPVLLTAGSNAEELIRQAIEFNPAEVVIGDESRYEVVEEALSAHPVKVWAGEDALCQAAGSGSLDIVVAAMVGIAGLKPVLEAIRAGHDIALANKEILVVAGQVMTSEAKANGVRIIPVDSEHSAIFQCLAGEAHGTVHKLILTASGGPFRKYTTEQLADVKPGEALSNPNWDMGKKVSVDSASLMNKGLEAIEAHWLFGVPSDKIEVVIHPQSVVHSMVAFRDGSVKAQLSYPDMRIPIQYALSWPLRLGSDYPGLNFGDLSTLTFEQADPEKFRNLALAFDALERGGNMPCILNAANEVAVESFLAGKLAFTQMPDLISRVMKGTGFMQSPSLDDLFKSDKQARQLATKIAGKY